MPPLSCWYPRDGVHDSVTDVGLEFCRCSVQPAQCDCRVAPCEHVLCKASAVMNSNLLRSWAPHNSSRGVVEIVSGVTLVLAMVMQWHPHTRLNGTNFIGHPTPGGQPLQVVV